MKKKVFFFLYCFLMIGGLVLFLIFSPKFIQNSTLKDKNGNSQTSEYATKIKLNCDDNIILSVGSSVELTNGYISVEPSSMLNTVTSSLTCKSGSADGLSFENNKITAKSKGIYLITFAVRKSSTTEIYDALSISVVEKENDTNVKLLNNNFTNNTTINVSEIIQMGEGFSNLTIQNNQHMSYSNNQILFTEVGNSTLNLNFKSNYLSYNYKFDVLIKQKTTSGIIVEGETNGVLEVEPDLENYVTITFYLKKESGEYVLQNATVTANTDSIENIEVLAPIITFKCTIKTSFKLTITPTNSGISEIEILIIIK